MRSAGILLAVSSIPSPCGIGTFSESARRVVDQLKNAGQHFWQVLPLGPTGYGDSPYQAFSAFAGNPYFIDLDTLCREGLLKPEEYRNVDFGTDPGRVDYAKLYRNRFGILRKAFSRSGFREEEEYQAFCRENDDWLEDYSLFMGIKNLLKGQSWFEWPRDIRLREEAALEEYRERVAEEAVFFRFLQYEFSRQWKSLKEYANGQGLEIIGDIPIYVAPDSSDAWAHPELFQFNEDRKPSSVAGCPPDAFSADGQLWGNPLYDWNLHEKTGFAWWKRRIGHCLELYDVVRVDHFRGFDAYYAIPAKDRTAAGGEWRTGPGMKVIEFAFDSRDGGDYFPFNYEKNTVVYTGTHDNQTLRAWYEELSDEDRQLADDYLGLEGRTPEERTWAFIRMAMQSVSDTCVIPMQDYLDLGAEARMNHPSTSGGNWCWRMKEEEFTEELQKKVRRITQISGRL